MIATDSDYENLSLPNGIEDALGIITDVSSTNKRRAEAYSMTSCSQWNEDTSTHRISTYIPD
jgi:hypothetical protein